MAHIPIHLHFKMDEKKARKAVHYFIFQTKESTMLFLLSNEITTYFANYELHLLKNLGTTVEGVFEAQSILKKELFLLQKNTFLNTTFRRVSIQ